MSVALRYARDHGYSAERILDAFCKAHPRYVEFCPKYLNVRTSSTLFNMAAFPVNDQNKSGVVFFPDEYEPNK